MSDEISDLFKRSCEQAIKYRLTVGEMSPRPAMDFHQMLTLLLEGTPELPTPSAAVLDELISAYPNGLMGITGPRFFGWVMGGSHPVGVAGDWLVTAWGQPTGTAQTSFPAAIEEVARQWLLDLLHLPPQASIGFVTGATMANFTCLAAARTTVLQATGWNVETDGLFGAPQIEVFVGEEAHVAVSAALQYLGLGRDRVQRIVTDDQGRMSIAALSAAVRQSTAPKIIIAQAGHVNTGSFDDFARITEIAERCGAWLHIDGAFGLWAAACPSKAWLVEGAEKANSWAVDGHKWLQTPYDSGYAIVRDAAAHQQAMSMHASYLPEAHTSERWPADFVPELSRRSRGVATWAVIKALGRRGIAAMIERHCELAKRFASRLSAVPGISVLNEVVLNQVIVGFGNDQETPFHDELAAKVIERIQSGGVCFMAGTRWRGRWAMRISVISWSTTEKDVDRSIEAIITSWNEVKLANEQS